MEFQGMVKVSASKAEKGVMNCLCYVERYRNQEFSNYVDIMMESYDWTYALLNDHTSIFSWLRGKKSLTREESLCYCREHDWYPAYETSRKEAISIWRLVKASDDGYVYLNPTQAYIVNQFSVFESKDITAELEY